MANTKNVYEATDGNFKTDVMSSGLSMVDFWAEWCGPCKMIAPMLDQIAAEYAGRVRVAKMNVDESPKTPAQFNVRSIPTLILFKNGKAEGQKIGAVRKADVAAFLDSRL